jgi:hypothetical protein
MPWSFVSGGLTAVYVLPSALCHTTGLVPTVNLADPRLEADLRMPAEVWQ